MVASSQRTAPGPNATVSRSPHFDAHAVRSALITAAVSCSFRLCRCCAARMSQKRWAESGSDSAAVSARLASARTA
eukprot:4397410-Prymnesium_polylepis.2